MQSLTVARLHPVLASGTLVLENEVSSERFCPISPSEKKKFFFCILRDAIEAKRVLSGSCVQDEPPTGRTKIKNLEADESRTQVRIPPDDAFYS